MSQGSETHEQDPPDPGGSTVTVKVSGAEAGMRLDRLLASAPRIGSRAAAQRLISGGLVQVEGSPRGKNYRVSAGETITVSLPPPEVSTLEPEEMDLLIPYQDEYLLVVDKPAGIVTHPAKGHRRGTLVHGLLAHGIAGGRRGRPGIVHRLDKDTSGLLVVARDEKTQRLLAEMMADHEIERTYLALVHGLFDTREGTVEAPVGRDTARRQQMAVAGAGGREAVTHFQVLKSWAAGAGPSSARGDGYSLLEVRLETGRTHQIRVHLAAIGHPVAGDATYGRRRDELGIGRQFLHSARLNFRHPRTGEAVSVESPLPSELQRVLDALE